MLQRRDTAANWTANNTILGAGEFGVESDTGQFKIGDGTSGWTLLDYAGGGGGGGINLTGTTDGETIVWDDGAWAVGPDIGGYTKDAIDPNVYDPYWDYVTLLIDFDNQVPGSYTFTGAEKANKFQDTIVVWESQQGAFGTTQIVNTQSKWGTTSLYSDGSWDASLSTPLGQYWGEVQSIHWPVTHEAWVRLDTAAGYWSILIGGSNYLTMGYWNGEWVVYYSGTYLLQVADANIPTNEWMHLAFVAYDSGGEYAIYLNGTRVAYVNGSPVDETSMSAGNTAPKICDDMEGYIAEVRITNAARYSGLTFDVPTAKFPTQGPPAGVNFGAYNKYSITKTDDVDVSTLDAQTGSSLVYYKTDDKWLVGPTSGYAVPDGDPLWSDVLCYYPMDGDMTVDLGSDAGASLTSTPDLWAGYSEVPYTSNRKFGRTALRHEHSNISGASFALTNLPFPASQDWCIDFWFYLDSSVISDVTPVDIYVNGVTGQRYEIEFRHSTNFGNSYYLFNRGGGQAGSTTYNWHSATSGEINTNLLPLDEWFHCAVIYDFSMNCVRTYINGKRMPFSNMWLSANNNTTLAANLNIYVFPGASSFDNSLHALSDFRITTNSTRYTFTDITDSLETFSPDEARLTTASTSTYVWLEENKADYIQNTTTVPATASSSGKIGDIRYDADYVYICVAPDTWKRAGLSTW